MMEKFEFLLGDWDLEYNIPASKFSEQAGGTGSGSIKRALDDRYVFFDYDSLVNGKSARAHGIFAWDARSGLYRYWWFESSGNFLTASCDFINETTLLLNWHDTFLRQTFSSAGADTVLLQMENPDAEGTYELVLEVVMKRINQPNQRNKK